MKFIDNARDAWHHYSTIALTAATGLQGAWVGIPESIKENLPVEVGQTVSWVCFGIVLLGLFGKFVKQSDVQ